jgi:hypothetical protein
MLESNRCTRKQRILSVHGVKQKGVLSGQGRGQADKNLCMPSVVSAIVVSAHGSVDRQCGQAKSAFANDVNIICPIPDKGQGDSVSLPSLVRESGEWCCGNIPMRPPARRINRVVRSDAAATETASMPTIITVLSEQPHFLSHCVSLSGGCSWLHIC